MKPAKRIVQVLNLVEEIKEINKKPQINIILVLNLTIRRP